MKIIQEIHEGIDIETGEKVVGNLNILGRYDKYYIFKPFKLITDNILPIHEVHKDSIKPYKNTNKIETYEFVIG